MAHIRNLDTGRYQVRYRDPTNRERARNFPRKVDAERFMHTVEVDKLRGKWADPMLGRITFGEWNIEHQTARNARRPSTRVRDESVLRKLVLPTFGDLRLSAIQPVTVRQWVASLTDAGKAPGRSARRISSSPVHSTLRSATD